MARKRQELPVHWNHDGDAANVIGYIDPATMRETSEGLQVSGKLDLADSDTAREAWRSMKNNAMSLSFGFLTLKNNRRSDGVNELQEIDLFEISIVPAPANADTRVLAMKAINDPHDHVRTEYRDLMTKFLSAGDADALRAKAERIVREHAPIQVATFDA
jgi:HK97 family phage prohead protease